MLDTEKMEQLKRYVEDPTLFSDSTLRAEIARLFGWRVGRYPEGFEPETRAFWERRGRESAEK